MAMQEHFLVCTNDYKVTSVGLFCNFTLIDSFVCDNKQASKQLFLFIDALLQRNHLTLESCAFLAANQGPGPFTTLRAVIASINGLAFATKKPLVGVNNIEVFVHEHAQADYDYVVALNNAYCNDVYYALLDTKKNECTSGCVAFESIIEMLNNLPASAIKIIGGIAHEKRIELGDRITQQVSIPDQCPEYASLEALGKKAYQQWSDQKNIVAQLVPLYLKQYTVRT